MAENERTLRKNPSRKECEDIIRRILMTEMLEKGKNEHFKTAADFMKYFESLYPASDSLTKQVQRAIKSLGMPKDANGYFIINKTAEQLDQDHELTFMLQKSHAHITSLDNCETLFLATDSNYICCNYFRNRKPVRANTLPFWTARTACFFILKMQPNYASF